MSRIKSLIASAAALAALSEVNAYSDDKGSNVYTKIPLSNKQKKVRAKAKAARKARRLNRV